MKMLAVALAAAFLPPVDASAAGFGLISSWLDSADGTTTTETCRPEVGFSPEGSAAQLVGRAIDSAQKTIHLAAYTFTSPDVVRRLIAAKRRGVAVAVVVDEKENLRGQGARYARSALNLLSEAGIPIRTIGSYPLHHDKTITIDGDSVETGSLNFTTAGARRNSENALVIWHCPSVAGAYEAHWQSRWDQGVPYRMSY
nr:phospholipase D family protein [Burkholderia alba]